jgi:hypothetical protein
MTIAWINKRNGRAINKKGEELEDMQGMKNVIFVVNTTNLIHTSLSLLFGFKSLDMFRAPLPSDARNILRL